MRRTKNSPDKPFELDNVDKKILAALIDDSRRPYIDIAHDLNVSGGTIHVRMDKLKKAGVVKGSRLILDYQRLGYGVSAFVGINLHNAKDYKKVIERVSEIPEIVEAHYSTGDYNIFTKVIVRSIADLHLFLLDLQGIREIQSTATIMILDMPISRELKP